ncbi:MAG: hypothetical protein HY913_02195 [Desulfomonile tiedjei]|nr:hypothetical protein [Desulfomonile tiedjei]
MNIPWDGLAHVQNFIRLDFLFSGLEVSSTELFAARMAVFLLFGCGLLWAVFKIIIKLIDCIQALLGSVVHLPKSFFLLLLLVIPLSPESLGARSLGYILLITSILGLLAACGLFVVLWKYGVDQAIVLVNSLRTRSEDPRSDAARSSIPPENVMGPVINSPVRVS